MANGTFKFEVVDDFDKDIEYLKVRYPSASTRTFRKALLTGAAADTSDVRVVPTSVSSTTAQASGGTSVEPVVAPTRYESGADNCTVSQILEMKKLGLSDGQIKKGCGGAR
jgi:hypothetical protein